MKPEQTKKLSGKPKNQILSVKSVIIGFLLVLFFIVSLFAFGRYRFKIRDQHARAFISQMIVSVIEQTSFYKEHANERGLKDIENYDVTKLTNNFDISIIDVYWGDCFEYLINFDNQNSIKVQVHFLKKGLILHDFDQTNLRK